MQQPTRNSLKEAMLPLVCAVHCMVTPVISPVLSVAGHNPGLEYGRLSVALLVAAISYGFGLKHHRNHLVWSLGLLGFLIWGMSLGDTPLPFSEAQGSTVGSVTVASTLLWNGHLRHKATCGECVCPIHRD